MKNKATPLVDEHLQSLQGMREVGAGDFFYTRLKARMDQGNDRSQLWRFPLRPVWLLGTLIVLLGMNGFMLSQQYRSKHISAQKGSTSIQNFAEAYDQTINASY